MYGEISKKCKICGKVIATHYLGSGRNAKYNALQYCPDCAATRRKQQKLAWQGENRRNCRISNKRMKKEIEVSKTEISVMERHTAALEAEARELERRVKLLEEENRRLKVESGAMRRGGIFGKLSAIMT